MRCTSSYNTNKVKNDEFCISSLNRAPSLHKVLPKLNINPDLPYIYVQMHRIILTDNYEDIARDSRYTIHIYDTYEKYILIKLNTI